jgi:hypothetical protein
VIATGFDRAITGESGPSRIPLHGVLQFPEKKRAVAGGGSMGGPPFSVPAPAPRTVTPRAPAPPKSSNAPAEVSDMEIPTFIRRQMD